MMQEKPMRKDISFFFIIIKILPNHLIRLITLTQYTQMCAYFSIQYTLFYLIYTFRLHIDFPASKFSSMCVYCVYPMAQRMRSTMRSKVTFFFFFFLLWVLKRDHFWYVCYHSIGKMVSICHWRTPLIFVRFSTFISKCDYNAITIVFTALALKILCRFAGTAQNTHAYCLFE